MRVVIILFLSLNAVVCFSQSDLETIKKLSVEFSSDYVNGDFEAVANAYTEDALLFPPGKDIVVGRKAIYDFWAGLPKVTLLSHKAIPDTIIVNGNEAHDYGYVFYTVKNENAGEFAQPKSASKYYILWIKDQQGKWKMKLDIWNSRDKEWNKKSK